jgi:Lar family restriction alleviation protein
MKKIDMKPCPHCGGVKLRIDDSGVYKYGPDEKPTSYWVVCLTCFATGGPGRTREEAAEKWNTRSLISKGIS